MRTNTLTLRALASASIRSSWWFAPATSATHARRWVALVAGANHQLDRIEAEAKARKVNVFVLIDVIHVREYLWKAVWCFYPEGDPPAETWVHDKARAVLAGRATGVAGAIRRTATNRGLDKAARKGADVCSRYLTNKARYLDYPTALANGWPIATGVIEGACRHLVKDRLDLTGARWGLRGAEAVLKLRAIRCNGDWDTYWTLLDLSPRPGAAPSPRVPLRRQHHPASGMNSLQRSRTLIRGDRP